LYVALKDLRKKRDEERQKQLRWREEHRNALIQDNVNAAAGAHRDSSDTGHSESLPPGHRGDPPPPPPPPPPGAPGSGGAGPGAGMSLDSVGRTRALYGVDPRREQTFRQKQWRHVRLSVSVCLTFYMSI